MSITDGGTLHHVCYVVRDLRSTAKRLAESLAIKPWEVWRIQPEVSTLHGREMEISFYVGIARVGGANYELIQPISKESCYAEHLAAHGEGVHHSCISYSSRRAMQQAKAELVKQGRTLIQSGYMGEIGEFCYFEVPDIGILELLFLAELPPPLEVIA